MPTGTAHNRIDILMPIENSFWHVFMEWNVESNVGIQNITQDSFTDDCIRQCLR